MLCTRCGKSATQYVKKEGEELTLTFCDECYREYCKEQDGKRERYCPECGTTMSEYRRTGLFGCGECYHVFREEILPILKKVQGGLRHEGKELPAPEQDDYEFILEQERVKSEIAKSLREGDYQRAKQLQNELARRKRGLSEQEAWKQES